MKKVKKTIKFRFFHFFFYLCKVQIKKGQYKKKTYEQGNFSLH